MKRAIAVALALGMLGGALAAPAEAGKKKKKVSRSAEATYTGAFNVLYLNAGGQNFGGVALPTGSGEKFVSIEIKDASGLPSGATVGQDLNGDDQADTSTPVCGKSAEPIEIEPGYDVTVFLKQGPCDGGPAIVTEGTVVATFSNLP